MDYPSRSPRSPTPSEREAARDVPPKPPHVTLKVEPTPMLGVFGLSVRTTERDLQLEFERYGEIEKVVIIYDQRTGRSRGFGFITMGSVEDAAECIEKLNGFNLHGRNIRVDYSATRKAHDPTPGQYMGPKRPIIEDQYNGRIDRYDDRRRFNDYPQASSRERARYGNRDRHRMRETYDSRRQYENGQRQTRYDDRDYDYGYHRGRRSLSPCRDRYSVSPDRRHHGYRSSPGPGEVGGSLRY
ncbi:uncharacterized protein L203_103642 [Cryptococcus depauperatus CBS 7841]|uniref:RRM domain-containing protein n=1 Tax=Cryptococcus depauperatus CBS 7841 TaxID=1295531 RepID=A0AAJ8JU10_9TREE